MQHTDRLNGEDSENPSGLPATGVEYLCIDTLSVRSVDNDKKSKDNYDDDET